MLSVRTTAFEKAASDLSGSAPIDSVSSDDLSAAQVHLLSYRAGISLSKCAIPVVQESVLHLMLLCYRLTSCG